MIDLYLLQVLSDSVLMDSRNSALHFAHFTTGSVEKIRFGGMNKQWVLPWQQ